MTKFEAYMTNLGLFVHMASGYTIGPSTRINGIPSAEFAETKVAHNSYTTRSWYFLEGIREISTYERLQPGGSFLVGYNLKVPSVASDEIPAYLTVEQVEQYYDDEGDYCWGKFADFRSLYEPVNERREGVWVPEEFTVHVLRQVNVESFESPAQMKVTVDHTGSWVEKPTEHDLSAIVTYDDLERLLTPEPLLHERPCSLSSSQVYGIVRHHVKNNISPRYARVTSDYDFCFTVKKRISVKPVTSRHEVKKPSGRSYAKPKWKTTTTEFKEVEIFEMTPADKPYGGYTPIAPWHAQSLADMRDQISSYLEELMEGINRPVAECPSCNGTGHLVDDKIPTNDRG